MKKHLLAVVITLIITPSVYADKPDWAGKGKPTLEEIRNSENQQNAISDIENKERQTELLLEEKRQNQKQAKNNKEQKNNEVPIKGLDDTQKAANPQKDKYKNKKAGKGNNKQKDSQSQIVSNDDLGDQPPKGLQKQREKKIAQERKEQGKGSEKGQTQREEKSRKWWKFWE